MIGKAFDPDMPRIPDPFFTPLAVVMLFFILWPAAVPAMYTPPPEHVQRMLNALRTISTSHKAMERFTAQLQGQRDRLIVELHKREKLVLREIAPFAGMHHTRVGKIARKPEPPARFLLLTPEIPDWNVATPSEVIGFLRAHYPRGPSPTNEEIQTLLNDHQANAPKANGSSAAWPWWVATTYDVFERAMTNRQSLSMLEVLSSARAMMLSGTWRVAMVGSDDNEELRERGMSVNARLLDDVRQEDWKMTFVDKISHPRDPPDT
jgi:hypothetical protein